LPVAPFRSKRRLRLQVGDPRLTDSLRSELLHDRIDIHLTMVQMPALNTPQFDWGRNKLRKRPQPVPPIFQLQVAAEVIVFSAYPRRH